ncbi:MULTISPECIES: spore cortex biosynthesis protein YabQ [Niallia]|jgi:spore cortex biosynthesis protein YabQ|uniref:Spore cortex biosynthesis protein YabQ n=1 Tax=Niallia circulans TaxID=1397 RepID=A0A268F693_NIACI|nr:spore cortex biosynthesis protein YabQ [Niallia circulans]AYV68807.1 spore cortex biosynthesis protein YabQ [Niallia circulans]NRG26073.1 spore cortex biosynthesis protein YabQ [Niallia circulans]PAD80864.1 spore cortex biosynthesis protein YabQ [Niallia circulans]QJX60286.1 spore cortex biosynthesis protein YabQ [Niallia circulans]UQZ75161.1 spore cortex biosynthesis protein YabQ [Niallia circulans]
MTLSTQFMTMLAMVSMGLFFGISLDTYQYFLKRPKRKRSIVFIHDILFWVLQALLMFYVLFLVNKGEVRIYLVLALLLGFAMYKSLFQTLYLQLLKGIISFCVHTYRFFLRVGVNIVYKPIKSIIFFLFSIIIALGRGLMALVSGIIRTLRFIIGILFKPIEWLLSLLWLIVPKKGKLFVERIFNKLAGYYFKIKNYLKQWMAKRKK